MTDKERALAFSRCNCSDLEKRAEYTICMDCGFMRSLNIVVEKKGNKISKRDQLAK